MTIIKALKKRFGGNGQTIAKVIETIDVPSSEQVEALESSVEALETSVEALEERPQIPAFTAADNGKVLTVVNGALSWVTPE